MALSSNLYFRPLANDKVLAVREVRGSHLGKLITVRGIVTRVSEVKPLLQVNAYTCDQCGAEIFQDVGARKLTPLSECISDACVTNSSRGQLHMQTRACKFTPFQECKIQEMVSRNLLLLLQIHSNFSNIFFDHSLSSMLTLLLFRLIKYQLVIFLDQ